MAENIFIGIGSNVGDRFGHLRWAVQQLSDLTGVSIESASSVYESEAHTWGDSDEQSAYLNAVINIKADLGPLKLLAICLQLELERGRLRGAGQKWEPRTLDLDILAFDTSTLVSDSLVVPHPRIAERRFVLEPWNEIAPGFVIPDPYGCSVADLLLACNDTSSLEKLY